MLQIAALSGSRSIAPLEHIDQFLRRSFTLDVLMQVARHVHVLIGVIEVHQVVVEDLPRAAMPWASGDGGNNGNGG